MGEAKRRRDRVRADLLRQAERWNFPATDWERDVVAALRPLPVVRVPRGDDRVLHSLGMVPQRCHANAHAMVERDPLALQHVTGWMPQDGNFTLHSVVCVEGTLVCVTPAQPPLWGMFTHVDFIPDPRVEWRRDGAYRDGVAIGPGVRADPAETMRRVALVREALLEGMDPRRAVPDAVLEVPVLT